MLIFPHSSQASICPPKADVLHFLMQIKFLIARNLILNLPILNLICLKHRRLRIEVEIEVELAVFFYGFKTSHFFPNSEKKVSSGEKRVFVWKVVQFEDKSMSYQYFRDPRDF